MVGPKLIFSNWRRSFIFVVLMDGWNGRRNFSHPIVEKYWFHERKWDRILVVVQLKKWDKHNACSVTFEKRRLDGPCVWCCKAAFASLRTVLPPDDTGRENKKNVTFLQVLQTELDVLLRKWLQQQCPLRVIRTIWIIRKVAVGCK